VKCTGVTYQAGHGPRRQSYQRRTPLVSAIPALEYQTLPDYYHWWNAERGKPTPRWSFFDVNSDAWKYDTATNAYYLHYFSRKQPDLNWENPRFARKYTTS
jgi:glycosidase